MPDFSRQSFRPVDAPRDQRCSCGCGQPIEKGQRVFARRDERSRGDSRVIDLDDHYRSWLDKEARKAASIRAASDQRFKEYLNG